MKLIGSNASPFVRKVRIVLAEKRLECRYEQADVWGANSGVQQINPLGKIPALVMDDGMSLYDSPVIVEYLDTLSPVNRLIPPSGRVRAEVRCWEALADGLQDAAALARQESIRRPPEKFHQPWVDRQLAKIDAALAAMSTGLGDKEWCVDARFSLADIATGCALGYLDFRFPQIDWRSRHANLARHAGKLFRRQSFIDTAHSG
ncbi:MAG: glutathione S-transferase N-terminal domain-containing protein [Burkholderiales bacterium]|nr:MAG: glutathione S-transferase N-terminal domain-containing protein [Burkholderiales bacterium]